MVEHSHGHLVDFAVGLHTDSAVEVEAHKGCHSSCPRAVDEQSLMDAQAHRLLVVGGSLLGCKVGMGNGGLQQLELLVVEGSSWSQGRSGNRWGELLRGVGYHKGCSSPLNRPSPPRL